MSLHEARELAAAKNGKIKYIGHERYDVTYIDENGRYHYIRTWAEYLSWCETQERKD